MGDEATFNRNESFTSVRIIAPQFEGNEQRCRFSTFLAVGLREIK